MTDEGQTVKGPARHIICVGKVSAGLFMYKEVEISCDSIPPSYPQERIETNPNSS